MTHPFTTIPLVVLITLYSFCIIILSFFGFNSLSLAVLYLINRRKQKKVVDKTKTTGEWPFVTIQLPIYNESTIIERLIDSMIKLDYPPDRYEIQVLDDSTDETTELAENLVERYRGQGRDITLIHRDDRTGYKAGALSEGLKRAKGEFLAIFDADFTPGPEWLKRTIVNFDHPRIGCVQTRWGHLNYRYNMITNAVGLALDAHFMVEQNARSLSDLFLGFNGSGGLWRKAAIIDAGGWASDTLTEDLDLSYRAQLKGWRIVYTPEIEVPGELPAQMDAFKAQQYRWAKGSAQTLRKLGGIILRAKVPWYKKVMAILHLSMYVPFPFMLASMLLTLPIAYYANHVMKYFSWTILASLGPPLLYSIAHTTYVPRLRDRLVRLPMLLLLGLGMSLNSGFAVISGLFTKGGVFQRTPKFNIKGQKGTWTNNRYALSMNPVVFGEILLGFYAIFTVVVLWQSGMGKVIAPGMFYYAISYFFMAMISLIQSWQHWREAA